MGDTLDAVCHSGELRLVRQAMHGHRWCPCPTLNNSKQKNFGKKRAACGHKGIRPSVRWCCYEARSSHPHGGGDGRTSGGFVTLLRLGQAHKGLQTPANKNKASQQAYPTLAPRAKKKGR